MKRLFLVLIVAGIAMVAYLVWSPSGPVPETPSGSLPDATASPASGNTAALSTRTPPDSSELGPTVREAIDASAHQRGPADIVVQVLDPRRRPIAGVPVALSQERQLHETNPDQRGIKRTDAKGQAVFWSRRRELSMAKEPWFLVHDVCFEQQPFVLLDSHALSQDVIVSIQPPYGSVDVVAAELDASTPANLDRAELSLIDPAEAGDPTLAWKRTRWSAKIGPDHRARFEFVELGRQCAAAVYRRGGETPSTAQGDGPVVAFEQRQIDVVLDVDHAVAVFRAVDARGVPLVNAPLVLTLHKHWSGPKSAHIATGADGRFTVDSNMIAFLGQHISVKATVVGHENVIIGVAEIPRRLKKGRTDCGDVVLRPSGALVSGRVFDSRGQPAQRVRVCAGRQVSYRYQQSGFVWSFFRTVDARTNDHGDFVIQGELPYPRFKVWVDDGNRRSAGVDVTRGTKDARLTCFRVYVPSVDVIMADGVSWDGVKIHLWPAGSTKGRSGTKQASRDGNTVHVKMSAVQAGNYDLTWTLGGMPLGRQKNLRIEADGLIAKIDLRLDIAGHEITLQPPEQRDAKTLAGVLMWQPSTGAKSWQSVDFKSSPIRFTAPAKAIDLRIYTRGFRQEDLRHVSGPQTVVLRPGLRVRLVLRTTGKLPEHPYIFDPWPNVQHKSVGEPIGSRYYTRTKREATFLLPSGQIEIGWHLERRGRNGAIGGTVLDKHRVTIDVKEIAGEQVFYLDLDGKALSALVKNVGW